MRSPAIAVAGKRSMRQEIFFASLLDTPGWRSLWFVEAYLQRTYIISPQQRTFMWNITPYGQGISENVQSSEVRGMKMTERMNPKEMVHKITVKDPDTPHHLEEQDVKNCENAESKYKVYRFIDDLRDICGKECKIICVNCRWEWDIVLYDQGHHKCKYPVNQDLKHVQGNGPLATSAGTGLIKFFPQVWCFFGHEGSPRWSPALFRKSQRSKP